MASQFYTLADPDLYVMADEDLIETSRGARRELNQIQKHPEPVIVPDRGWEGAGLGFDGVAQQDPFYANVLYDPADKNYKCWYQIANRFSYGRYMEGFANQGSGLCYAVSEDGINWEKPELDHVLHMGRYGNNMLRVLGPEGSGTTSSLHSVVHNIDPSSEDRFIGSARIASKDPFYSGSLTIGFSPDGINWRILNPPVQPGDGETNALNADPLRNQYIVTARSTQYANLAQRWNRKWKRIVTISLSRQLYHWTPPLLIMEADDKDPEDTEIYKMPPIPYGHGYLGQMLMFYTHTMTLDTQIAWSRDLMNWQRLGERKPILARGEDGSWDSQHVTLVDNHPNLEGDTLRFWYGGKDMPHYQAGFGGLGTGTLRRDGFISWEAGDEEGILTTLPMSVKGQTVIKLNVDAAGGEARVEIIDEGGNPVPGYTYKDCKPVTVDNTRAVVSFKDKTIPSFDGKVRLRFYIRNAKLYAFEARNLEICW